MILTPHFVRQEASKEQIAHIDFSCLTAKVNRWWMNRRHRFSNNLVKNQLIAMLLMKLNKEQLKLLDNIGKNYIAGICITNIFSIDDPLLALTVHEVLCDLCNVNDIKYVYEDHKALYLKPSGEHYKNWGNGYGEITAHSDDLYEEHNVDFLALTVCRDLTSTPTHCLLPKDILKHVSDKELADLIKVRARFKSGKNISILKERERQLIDYHPDTGLNFYFDFRIDTDNGERMIGVDKQGQAIINKLGSIIPACQCISSVPDTGTFFIIANHKALHARKTMNIDKQVATNIAQKVNFSNTPRLLFRSKGPRKIISIPKN